VGLPWDEHNKRFSHCRENDENENEAESRGKESESTTTTTSDAKDDCGSRRG